MTAGDDQPRLKVDRLARAMAVARTRSVEPVAAETAARPGSGAHVAGEPGMVSATAGEAATGPATFGDAGTGPAPAGEVGKGPATFGAPPQAPDTTVGATPLILTSELMRVPPAGGVGSPAPAAPPARRASATVVLRSRPEPAPDALPGDVPAAPPAAISERLPDPAPQSRFGPPVLSLSGVGLEAPPLASVRVDVPVGGVTVLLGTPGVAASALLRAVMGLQPLVTGQVRLDGQDITRWHPRQIARAGVGYLPGDLGLFPSLSVAENLSLGALAARLPGDRLDAVFRLFPALRPVWHRPAQDLDRAGAQMLALARLMAERRRLYLVDTVAMTAGSDAPPGLLTALRELKLQGATVLLAAQSLPLAAAFADTCVALAAGQVVWSGPMTVMAEDADLQAMCFGPGGGAW